jgi:alkylhydroperoxidase/carboxymuconolactone decarboxylase family protein YurZ
VALLAAQGRDEDLQKDIRGARHQGISEQQILEIMIHASHYAGWSAGNSGQRIAL